jgi:hypothetical protein
MRNWSLILFAFILLTSADTKCSKKKEKDFQTTYKWIKTSCCFKNPVITTPESCKCSKTLVLRADSTYSLIVNGEETQGVYQIRRGLDVLNPKDTTKMIYIGTASPAIMTQRKDTMTLNRGYMDLETETYVIQN